MGAVTYPARALPLVVPGIDRLPPIALAYLRLVGPAVLGALAAVNTVIVVDDAGRGHIHVGVEWLSVALCVAIVAWRKNLFLGLIAAVGLAAAVRALNLG
jgi:branched-subunit amino acid transport protein